MQLISGEKDWNHVSVQKLVTLNTCCDVAWFLAPPRLSIAIVCASVCRTICSKFSKKVGNGPVNKWLNLGGDPDHRLDTGIAFRISRYWEIRKVVNGRKSWHELEPIRQMAGLISRHCFALSLTSRTWSVPLDVAFKCVASKDWKLQFQSALVANQQLVLLA